MRACGPRRRRACPQMLTNAPTTSSRSCTETRRRTARCPPRRDPGADHPAIGDDGDPGRDPGHLVQVVAGHRHVRRRRPRGAPSPPGPGWSRRRRRRRSSRTIRSDRCCRAAARPSRCLLPSDIRRARCRRPARSTRPARHRPWRDSRSATQPDHQAPGRSARRAARPAGTDESADLPRAGQRSGRRRRATRSPSLRRSTRPSVSSGSLAGTVQPDERRIAGTRVSRVDPRTPAPPRYSRRSPVIRIRSGPCLRPLAGTVAPSEAAAAGRTATSPGMWGARRSRAR